jgi:outer membrane lipopolysaccharide assembly protein LptE/RlpB
MKKSLIIAVVLALVVLQQGCSFSVNGGIDTEAYWPNMRTKSGGSFGDPAGSRHEATRATRSHIRNNDGNGTDAFLRNFFDTSSDINMK